MFTGPNPYDKLLKTVDIGGTSFKYYDLQGLGEKYSMFFSIFIPNEKDFQNHDFVLFNF